MAAKANTLPDTNVVLRYLLRDNPEQCEQAERYFESVRTGGKKALLLESVLVECIYVLTKFYKVPKKEAADSLSALLRYKGFVNSDKEALLAALTLFAAEQLRQALAFAYDKLRRCKQKLASLFGRRMRPLIEGGLRGVYRTTRVVHVSLRRRINYVPVSRVVYVISCTAYRVNRFSCYEHLRH